MAKTVLIDTGPLVAALLKREKVCPADGIIWITRSFALHTGPMECPADGSHPLAQIAGVFHNADHSGKRSPWQQASETIRLVRRYKDTPMSLADACLVRMSEIHSDSSVFTTDSDFRIYRKNGRAIIPVLIPDV